MILRVKLIQYEKLKPIRDKAMKYESDAARMRTRLY